MTAPASFSSVANTQDRLIAGNPELLASQKVTLITGQNLTRGTVLGKITASGKYNKSLTAAVDGSQTPVAILAQDCDATAADTECLIYERGDFVQEALVLGTAHTIASIRAGLRALGIFLFEAVDA